MKVSLPKDESGKCDICARYKKQKIHDITNEFANCHVSYPSQGPFKAV